MLAVLGAPSLQPRSSRLKPAVGGALPAARGAHLAAVALKQAKKEHKQCVIKYPHADPAALYLPSTLSRAQTSLSRRPEHLILTPLNRWKPHKWEMQE